MTTMSRGRTLSHAVAVCSILALLAISCGKRQLYTPDQPYWVDADREDIPKPKVQSPGLIWEQVDRTAFDQAEQLLDLERDLRIILGRRGQALSINSYDQVPDCSWFTNRHATNRMTRDELIRGPAITDGPDTTGSWTVFRPKVQGATPGFWIEDSKGDRYIIKFDPPENPEMATAAAAITSRYFHAAGYNVPQETIVYWRPELAQVKPGVMFKDLDGVRREFTEEDLQSILDRVHHERDGRIRSLASFALSNPVGPFSYTGRRKDDPNDWCRHQDRRELRGLYVVSSLVNHYDLKDQNTLDAWVEEGGKHFLRHFLIDFGSTLGSDGDGSKPPIKGYANLFDLRDILVSLVTLGLKTWPWEHAKPYQYPSIGYFESELFEPDKFNTIVPNPAMEEMTNRDAYWGAKIVMAFRDDDIRALVSTGQLSNPDAEDYLIRTLIERRDKIGRHWFSKINPLDNFTLEDSGDEIHIECKDLAVKYGLQPANAKYEWIVKYRVKRLGSVKGNPTPDIRLDKTTMSSAYRQSAPDESEHHLFSVEMRTTRNGRDRSKPTRVWLWYHPDQSRFQMVAIEHLD